MNTATSLLVGLLLILGVGGIVYWQVRDIPTPATNTQVDTETNSANQENEGSTDVSAITMAVIAQHDSRTSCWSAINGSVYDLTSWIQKHPGGEQAILQLCGTDGSAKFNGQHGGQAKQATVLAGFKIGVLSK